MSNKKKKKKPAKQSSKPRKVPAKPKAPPKRKDGGFSTNSTRSGEQVNNTIRPNESSTPWLDGLSGAETMLA